MFTNDSLNKKNKTKTGEKKKEQKHSQTMRTYAGRWTELKKALNAQATKKQPKPQEPVKSSQAANTG